MRSDLRDDRCRCGRTLDTARDVTTTTADYVDRTGRRWPSVWARAICWCGRVHLILWSTSWAGAA